MSGSPLKLLEGKFWSGKERRQKEGGKGKGNSGGKFRSRELCPFNLWIPWKGKFGPRGRNIEGGEIQEFR